MGLRAYQGQLGSAGGGRDWGQGQGTGLLEPWALGSVIGGDMRKWD